MNFSKSENHLYSLGNEVSAMKLGLENIRTLLDSLGKPQEKYLKVQVAGTNGKGSVCAFLDSICREADINVGVFTSPHLISITERIKIGGRQISENDFAKYASIVRETAERLLEKGEIEYRPTFFEQITAIALVAFAEANVQLAILETGLGGRLDATTAANAEIAAITRIDLDHQEYLGDTIEEIAVEKAAIIRESSRFVVIGAQNDAAMNIIAERCQEFGVVPDLAEHVRTVCVNGRREFETKTSDFEVTNIGLKGSHQLENAKVAILLVESLINSGFAISKEIVTRGIEYAKHPGRLEYSGNYLFDGAHNVAGASALADYLKEFETRPLTLVFGAMRDKNIKDIAETLFHLASRIVITEPANLRALSYEEILDAMPSDLDKQSTFVTKTVANALVIAAEITPADGIILITGSLYLVGEVKKILNN